MHGLSVSMNVMTGSLFVHNICIEMLSSNSKEAPRIPASIPTHIYSRIPVFSIESGSMLQVLRNGTIGTHP